MSADETASEWNELAVLACAGIFDRMRGAGFVLAPPGYWSWRDPAWPELELALEPLTFGRWYLAVYVRRVLALGAKVEVTIPWD